MLCITNTAGRASGELKVTRVVDVPAVVRPPVPVNHIEIPALASHVFKPFGTEIVVAKHSADDEGDRTPKKAKKEKKDKKDKKEKIMEAVETQEEEVAEPAREKKMKKKASRE